MILEIALTAYLKRNYSKILQLDDFHDLTPPKPQAAKDYLIYIHVPFCVELCPYCSFNRVPLDRDLAGNYFDALHREIEIYADLGFNFCAAYIGGGTPTVVPHELARLLDYLAKRFSLREISAETNPNHLTDVVVRMLKDGGVNRLSVGVQSFEDSLLKQMERYHKYGAGVQIRSRLEHLIGTFDTLNVDMIFNFPTQTLEMLERDLEVIKEIQADQVTFYPLMVSDATRREVAQIFGPISYRKEKAFYNCILDALEGSYCAGTAWCFSRQKSMVDEYIVDYDEYVGVGSGSFGYVDGTVLSDTFSIPEYIESLRLGKLPMQAKKRFSQKERMRYEFIMKLFGTTLQVDQAEEKFGGKFMSSLWKEISFFKSVGALVSENGRLRLTRKGLYLWVIMMREFFTGVNNFRETCRARAGAPKTIPPELV
jgi:coproporphyrinogen III oxidase-like Fe-S oxidoreductase